MNMSPASSLCRVAWLWPALEPSRSCLAPADQGQPKRERNAIEHKRDIPKHHRHKPHDKGPSTIDAESSLPGISCEGCPREWYLLVRKDGFQPVVAPHP